MKGHKQNFKSFVKKKKDFSPVYGFPCVHINILFMSCNLTHLFRNPALQNMPFWLGKTEKQQFCQKKFY